MGARLGWTARLGVGVAWSLCVGCGADSSMFGQQGTAAGAGGSGADAGAGAMGGLAGGHGGVGGVGASGGIGGIGLGGDGGQGGGAAEGGGGGGPPTGAGEVICSSGPCDLTLGQYCCFMPLGGECHEASNPCYGGFSATCDGPEDCQPTEVCCGDNWGLGFWVIHCVAHNACGEWQNVLFCDPGAPQPCPEGSCQQTSGLPAGYFSCQGG